MCGWLAVEQDLNSRWKKGNWHHRSWHHRSVRVLVKRSHIGVGIHRHEYITKPGVDLLSFIPQGTTGKFSYWNPVKCHWPIEHTISNITREICQDQSAYSNRNDAVCSVLSSNLAHKPCRSSASLKSSPSRQKERWWNIVEGRTAWACGTTQQKPSKDRSCFKQLL